MKTGFTLFTMTVLVGALMAVVPIDCRAAVTVGADNDKPAPAPHIQFDQTIYDFGQVKPTDVVKHDFIFTNTGNATLQLTSVRPSCGCTTAGEYSKSVEPGQTGHIPIQFNPANFSGNVAKSVTVICNDPKQSTLHLQIKGAVNRPIQVTPRYAYFTVFEGNETNQTKVIRIINNSEEDIKVSDPEWKSDAFKAELKTIRPGREFEVHVELVPPIKSSRSITPITLKTTSTNMPVVTISAYALVQPAVQVIPQRIVLPYGPVGANNRYHVMIRSNGSKTLKLSDPKVNAEGVNIKMKETQAGRLFNLEVSFPGGFQVEAGKSYHLSVKSNSSSMPIVRVPIIQLGSIAPLTRPKVTPIRTTPRAAK